MRIKKEDMWYIVSRRVKNMIDIDKLIERNDKAFAEVKEKLEKLFSVETTTPEKYRDGLYEQIEKIVDQLSVLHRRGGYYEFKKSNNNKHEHNA